MAEMLRKSVKEIMDSMESLKKAVIFDMDGVILDSETLVFSCWEEIADKYNIPDITLACTECLGMNSVITKSKFLERYGADFPYDEYKGEMSARFHKKALMGVLKLKPGVIELLEYLKQEGFLIGLATSSRREYAARELKHLEVLKYFDVLIYGDMVKKSKPEPEIYLTAAKELGVKPEECYAVEDSYHGVHAGYRAKMDVIMVPDKLPPNEEMKRIAKIIVGDLNEMKEWFIREKRK